MPTDATFRWYGWRQGGAVSEPEPVLIRCAHCPFVAEGDLEHARRAFAEHECAADRLPKLQQLGDRFF
ncbi:MAG: hypothetical protein WKF41_17440 [Gaiellaceae bacterium]